jgi:hypothetical protein
VRGEMESDFCGKGKELKLMGNKKFCMEITIGKTDRGKKGFGVRSGRGNY